MEEMNVVENEYEYDKIEFDTRERVNTITAPKHKRMWSVICSLIATVLFYTVLAIILFLYFMITGNVEQVLLGVLGVFVLSETVLPALLGAFLLSLILAVIGLVGYIKNAKEGIRGSVGRTFLAIANILQFILCGVALVILIFA